MSDKDRRKKDGQDKNKKNQRRREGVSNATVKKAASASDKAGQTKAQDAANAGQGANAQRPAPAAARAQASKASKGK